MCNLAKQYNDAICALGNAPTTDDAASLVLKMEAIAQQAFGAAVAEGRLSETMGQHNFAGRYMFMGFNDSGKALFKHSMTREYLP